MKTITIGFSSPKTWKVGSELIKWWGKEPYSHVFINYQDDQERDLIFEASHGMVHLSLKEHFLEDNKIIVSYDLSLTDEQYQNFRDFYYDKLGQPYNFIDLIQIVIRDTLHEIGFNIKFKESKGFICSELTSRMLQDILGYQLPKDSWMMRPDDVEKLLTSNRK